MWYGWYFYHNKTFQASLSHAVITTFLTLCIYQFPQSAYPIAYFSLAHSFLYFLMDTGFRFNWSKLIHHLVAMSGLLIAYSSSPEVYIYTAKVSGILEVSGPFWTLLRLRIEKSDEIQIPSWYNQIISGMMFMITFFVARFMWYPYFIYFETPESIPKYFLWPVHSLLTSLNVYWWILLIKGFRKELQKKHSKT